jgi:hypothetical protein
MTYISLCHGRSDFCALSDVMATKSTLGEHEVTNSLLPLDTRTEGFEVVGYFQKTVLLSRNIVCAWAGSALEYRIFLERARRGLLDHSGPLETWVDRNVSDLFSNNGFFICKMDGERIEILQHDLGRIDYPNSVVDLFSGTGASYVHNFTIDRKHKSKGVRHPGMPTSIQLQKIERFIRAEQGILNYSGAKSGSWLEFTSATQKGFKKREWLFAQCVFNKKLKVVVPVQLVMSRYLDNLLIVARWDRHKPGLALTVVPEPDENRDSIMLMQSREPSYFLSPFLGSTWDAEFVLLRESGTGQYLTLHQCGNHKKYFRAVQDNNGWGFNPMDHLLRDLKRAIAVAEADKAWKQGV